MANAELRKYTGRDPQVQRIVAGYQLGRIFNVELVSRSPEFSATRPGVTLGRMKCVEVEVREDNDRNTIYAKRYDPRLELANMQDGQPIPDPIPGKCAENCYFQRHNHGGCVIHMEYLEQRNKILATRG